MQYRVDPGDPSDSWTVLGTTAADAEVTGFLRLTAPDDDAAAGQSGTRTRILQVRLVWSRPTTGTTRDVWDVLAVRFAALYPLGQSIT